MPKLTLTAGAILVVPVFPLVADLGRVAGGVIRPVRAADRGSNGYILTPENFSVLVADTPTSRFVRAIGRIFSTALNRFSITLSARAARASPP
jgi:sugar lactone lactonase YvrE